MCSRGLFLPACRSSRSIGPRSRTSVLLLQRRGGRKQTSQSASYSSFGSSCPFCTIRYAQLLFGTPEIPVLIIVLVPLWGCLLSQNVWFAQFMPISSRNSFDNTGAPYDVTRILNDDSTINLDKYRQYSPLFLSTTFAISVSFHASPPKRCI